MPEQLSARHQLEGLQRPALGIRDNVLAFFKTFQTNPDSNAASTRSIPTDFLADIKHGELPQVSWINPRSLQTEHPGFSSAKIGEYVVRT